MKLISGFLRLALGAALLTGCSPTAVDAAGVPADAAVTIIDGDRSISVPIGGDTAAQLLELAGVRLGPNDRILADGIQIAPDQTLPEDLTTLQVRRAFRLSLMQDGTETGLDTSAATVGQALAEEGIDLRAADRLDPPASSPILGPLTVTRTPSRPLTVKTGGGEVNIRSAAGTVGAALAGSGMPLQGADYSLPAAAAPLPSDGKVRVVRVNESVVLIQKSIPYGTQYQLSDKLELDRQDLLQVGQPGLSVSRVRVRYEDGEETARTTEAETTVRPPLERIIGTGTKIVIHTLDTPSGPREYWRAIRVYATSYSPCRSGGDRCYPGTAGGLAVRRGVVGVVRSWWYSMNGEQVYIPGYGVATISDIGAGIPGTPWIDLGFTDEEYESWHQWVTMYFLTPVPASILYNLE